MAGDKSDKPWEYTLRKYVLLLATVVATLTYSSAFSPPGGVWQDTDADHLAGDPIIRDTHYHRYLVFFYCNATGFASSLVVIILILLLSVQHEDMSGASIWTWRHTLVPLRVVMALDLLSILGAYAAATCRDAVTTTYSTLLVVGVFAYLMVQVALSSSARHRGDQQIAAGSGDADAEADADREVLGERPRKVLMLLATFAVSVTYVSGLSTPGGFWDGSQEGHAAGDAVLQDYNRARLVTFFLCNTTAFVASLLIILLLLDKKLRANAGLRSHELYGCIVVALAGLVAAYAAGSCRDAETTAYVVVLVAVILGYMLFQVYFAVKVVETTRKSNLWQWLVSVYAAASGWLRAIAASTCFRRQAPERHRAEIDREEVINESMDKARSLVLLLATLATSVTYQAGLVPPGDVWQDDGDGHLAGDPILLTTDPRRYKTFYYCNSTAFMASLAAIVLVQRRSALIKRHTLEAAMILDLFGLMGAYAAGSCRDVSTSIYVVALAGGVMVYVVIHVIFFTLDHGERIAGRQQDDDVSVEKRRKRLLLFAILAATITYQAGLTPPSGFWPKDDDQGHRAGEPVLLSNYPRRYKAFFYSNSLSFMSAIAHIILLVNPNLYRPAIRSYALSVCTAVGLLGLVGAYAAGSTQHLKTSIYIFVLAFLVILLMAVLFVVAGRKKGKNKGKTTSNVADESVAVEAGGGGTGGGNPVAGDIAEPVAPRAGGAEVDEVRAKKRHAKCKYLMLLGILMASVTYQAGLDPPGGVWQSDGDGHAAGDPVLRTNRRLRYLFFFHCNSTSFVASVVVVVLLLPRQLMDIGWWLTVTNVTIVFNLFGLLGAHAAGSSRGWETSGYIVAMIVAALAFVFVHALTSCFGRTRGPRSSSHLPTGDVPPQLKEPGSIGRRQPLEVSV
ncbi:uncharacterized protein [Miscanthus floridulus]|uniref:uncharacterized protein n=1 Tax=Miscanthus floridulus TaxID=154761 RepID=UPI0034576978